MNPIRRTVGPFLRIKLVQAELSVVPDWFSGNWWRKNAERLDWQPFWRAIWFSNDAYLDVRPALTSRLPRVGCFGSPILSPARDDTAAEME
jgi:hypothetical protein